MGKILFQEALIRYTVLVVIIGVSFTACSDPGSDSTIDDDPKIDEVIIQPFATFISFDEAGTRYQLLISRNTAITASLQSGNMLGTRMITANVASTPRVGDAFTISRIPKVGTAQTATGIISNITGITFTLQPSSQGATTFTLTVSGSTIITITGTIISDNGTQMSLPQGELSSTDPSSVNTLRPLLVKDVSASCHFLAVKTDGTLWAWGNNSYGQLGNGSYTSSGGPLQIGNANDWNMVSAGPEFSMAIKKNGTLWAWGRNYIGQLGDGTQTDRNSPVQVGNANDWATVSAGNSSYTAAIKKDGTLWKWGYDTWTHEHGNIYFLSPVQIGDSNDWATVSLGWGNNVALKTDGTIWGWGSNGDGQLGDNNILPYYNNPVQIGNSSDWISISAGYGSTVALKRDGTLWAWGNNVYGQLGDGTRTSRSNPVQIGTANDWDTISAGRTGHVMAVKKDGTLWAWGNNNSSELGDGTITHFLEGEPWREFYQLIPVQIGNDWAIVSARYLNTVGIRKDGSLWLWGRRAWGDNTFSFFENPFQVFENEMWTTIPF